MELKTSMIVCTQSLIPLELTNNKKLKVVWIIVGVALTTPKTNNLTKCNPWATCRALMRASLKLARKLIRLVWKVAKYRGKVMLFKREIGVHWTSVLNSNQIRNNSSFHSFQQLAKQTKNFKLWANWNSKMIRCEKLNTTPNSNLKFLLKRTNTVKDLFTIK